MRRFIILMVITMSISSQAFAQKRFFVKPGVQLGISLITEKLPEGFEYNPTMLLTSFSIMEIGRWDFYAETQLTTAADPVDGEQEYEGGLNFGVRYSQPLVKDLFVTGAIGAGPHFISVETDLQANGFIFSDNFEMGLAYNVPSIMTQFQLRARWRHISNAGLEEPNGGIDNGFLIFGFAKLL